MLLIPFETLEPWLDGLWRTQRNDRMFWHVRINVEGSELKLNRKKGFDDIPVSRFLVPLTFGDIFLATTIPLWSRIGVFLLTGARNPVSSASVPLPAAA